MNRRTSACAIALLLTLIDIGSGAGRVPTPERHPEPEAFVAIAPVMTPEPPYRDFPYPTPSLPTRPSQPATQPGVEARPTPTLRFATPDAIVKVEGSRATGGATWYCLPGKSACPTIHHGGLYAAAGPALRVGKWRGRTVTACTKTRCVTVTLVDWCACGGGHIIDLFADAYRRLAPLSTGVQRVTVTW